MSGRSFSHLASVSLIALTTLSGCASLPDWAVGNSSKPTTHVERLMHKSYQEAMSRAQSAHEDGKLEEAAGLYLRASQYMPQEIEPLGKLGDVLWESHNAVESARVLERARVIDPQNVTVLRNLGRAYVALSEFDKAQGAYLAALSADPSDTRTLNGLGLSYDLAGDHDTAQSHYRAGLTSRPADVDLQNNLAFSLISAGDYKQAIEVLEPLVNSASATARQRQNLALAYGMLGREEDVKRVASADLSPVEIERNLSVYRQLRNETKTKETLRSVGTPNFKDGSLSNKPTADLPPQLPTAEPKMSEAEPATATPVVVEPVTASAPTALTVEPATPAATAAEPSAPAESSAIVLTPSQVMDTPRPSASEKKAVKVQAAPAEPAPSAGPAPASVVNTTAFGSDKVFLGTFASEAAAREAWVNVWTGYSADLGSMVASIEPAAGQFALFAIGAKDAEAASKTCDSLKTKGISCSTGK
jgi:Flp pilus assembly protein TadD